MCRQVVAHVQGLLSKPSLGLRPWGLAEKNRQTQSPEGKFWFLLPSVWMWSWDCLRWRRVGNWRLWSQGGQQVGTLERRHPKGRARIFCLSPTLPVLNSWTIECQSHWITPSENTVLHTLKVWLRNKISKVLWKLFLGLPTPLYPPPHTHTWIYITMQILKPFCIFLTDWKGSWQYPCVLSQGLVLWHYTKRSLSLAS